MKYDLIIHSGCVIALDRNSDIIKNASVLIRNGRIERVEREGFDASACCAAEVVDAGGCIILPGLVNTHAHLPMSLFRGLADDLPLEEWLNSYIFPAEKKNLTPEAIRAGTSLSCIEMLLSGTTACCDGYFLEDHVAEAVLEAGMRAVLGHGVIDFPAPGAPDPARNVETASGFVSRWKEASQLIKPSVFCHSPYTCSGRTLARAKEEAAAEGILLQIHTAETRGEAEQIKSEHGLSPVKYLDSLGILDEKTLISHAVWVDSEDIEIIASRGAGVAHSPESNMKLASGTAPVPEFIKAGIPVGLGTDGCASNNNLDMFGEMDTAAKLHKAAASDPTVMNAEQVLRMATIEGARALGLDRLIGSVEPGKAADLIIVDCSRPHLTPMYHPVSHLVYSARGSDVRDVFINGCAKVRNGKLVEIDAGEIMEKAAALGRRIGSSG